LAPALLAALSQLAQQGLNAAPGALCAPDAGTQRLKLHDLAVVNEEIDVVAVILDREFMRNRKVKLRGRSNCALR